MAIQAVVFDLGGVVFESPVDLIRAYERKAGLPEHLIARIVGGYGGADGLWQKLERGELPLGDFCTRFDGDARALGHALSSADMMREMADGAALRPSMVEAIRKIRARGLKVGALTNNWEVGDDHDERLAPLRDEFHVFVESCKVRMRKPEPAIFELTARKLGVQLSDAAFLDDMGPNLKAARALGMTTIKVGNPETALCELASVLGFDLS
jgi:epoxide hydrolase-like predicted phosphatase